MNYENITRLKGKKCNLCIFRTDDVALNKYIKWINDESINFYLGRNTEIISLSEEANWANKALQENNKWMFNIVVNNNLIGNCELIMNKANAKIGILIGEEDEREKGIGTEAVSLMVKYAFEELNAHTVSLSVLASNKRARRCYEKCGFKECGVKHEHNFHNGKWEDTILMEILAPEYFKSVELSV